MRRSFLCLRALIALSLLGGSARFALAAPFMGGQPAADPELTPLGGPATPLGGGRMGAAPQPKPAPQRAAAQKPVPPRPARQIPMTQRPIVKSSAATKPPAGEASEAPNDERPPLYPGVTYADAGDKSTVAGQPAPAQGPAPYDLGLIKRLGIGGQILPQAPLRVGNLDVLSPFVDQIAALGVTVTRADPSKIPGNLNAPGENQYFQINFPVGADGTARPPIVLTIGKSMALIDGQETPLRAAPLVIDRQIFLPIFSIAPLIGAAARLNTDGTLYLTPTIQSVELFPIKDTVAVTIQASAPLAGRNIKIVRVAAEPGSSPKIYVDFEGFSMGFDAGNSTIERMVAPGAGGVLRARAGMPSKFPDTTRIVLDLKRPLSGMSQVVADPTLFGLVLAPQGAANAAVPPKLFNNPTPSDRTPTNAGPPNPSTKPGGAPASNLGRAPSLRGMTIVVDAGHGGPDTGAPGRYSLEKTHTLDIARRLRTALQARGATVLMTRDSDVKPELQDRVNFANSRRADLFISVHNNSSPSSTSAGTQTFYYTSFSQALAIEVQKELQRASKLPNRGIHQNRFVVVRYTAMPSVLTEVAFISNPREEALLRDPNFRERVARGIAQGVANYVRIYPRPGLRG